MNVLLAIDPGIHHCGAARFHDGLLRYATLVVGSKQGEGPAIWREMVRAVHGLVGGVTAEIVSEFPQVYFGRKQEVPSKSLVELAAVVGGIVTGPFNSTVYLPARWKQQLDKDQVRERVLDRLDEQEKSSIQHVGAKDHNTYEAIGIGLYHLGRFAPKRVYRR